MGRNRCARLIPAAPPNWGWNNGWLGQEALEHRHAARQCRRERSRLRLEVGEAGEPAELWGRGGSGGNEQSVDGIAGNPRHSMILWFQWEGCEKEWEMLLRGVFILCSAPSFSQEKGRLPSVRVSSSRSSGGIPDSPPGQAEILEWSAVLGVL